MDSPLTGGNNTQRIASLDPAAIADQWEKLLGVTVAGDFSRLPAIDYWECHETGLCWYSPREAAGDGSLYTQLEKLDWYYMQNKWEFDEAIKILSPNSRVLEIGVGNGHFLRKAGEGGHVVEGVELNPQAAERLRQRGFIIHGHKLEKLASIVEKFDAVVSFQVLEHVPDPGSFLRDILRLLRPGGTLILSVPNADVMRKFDPNHENLLDRPPHHMSHWNERVFRSLENFMPLKVRSIAREPLQKHHVSFVTGYLRGLVAPFVGRLVARLLFNSFTTLPVKWILLAGLRLFVPGHTLLVELEYYLEP